MRSLIRHSGSRMLHLEYWPQFSASVEQAVTVSGPSIAWMTSATEIIEVGARQPVAAARALVRHEQAAPHQALQHLGHQLDRNVVGFGNLTRARRRGVRPHREVLHRHQRVVGFLGQAQHHHIPSCSFATSDMRSFVQRWLPDDVDLRVRHARHGLDLLARPRPAATAPPGSRARSASCARRRRRPHRRRRRRSARAPRCSPGSPGRTPSGSRRRWPASAPPSVAASATSAARRRWSATAARAERPGPWEGSSFYAYSVEVIGSRSSAALSVCHAR